MIRVLGLANINWGWEVFKVGYYSYNIFVLFISKNKDFIFFELYIGIENNKTSVRVFRVLE